MTKLKQIDSLPEEFQSYEEAGKFWDAHDTTEYNGIFRTVERGRKARTRSRYWKDPSVLNLADGQDPIRVITEKAQDLVFEALEKGWSGPPFDPLKLAEIRNIKVSPRDDVGDSIDDARIAPDSSGKLTIEYNPNKPPARVRFSICHEIAHSFFSDCADHVRHRLSNKRMHGTNREMELLCNLAAAELLMPIGSFPDLADDQVSIKRVLDLRKEFEVSTEAVLLRTVRLSKQPLAAFSAVAKEMAGETRYVVEYCVGSMPWPVELKPGLVLPENTALRKCIAINYTTEGSETWTPEVGEIKVQAVGLVPYPAPAKANPSDYFSTNRTGASHGIPRTVGLIWPNSDKIIPTYPSLVCLIRDATIPVDDTIPTIIAHIVNDKTPNWGAGFGRFLAKKWSGAQDNFRAEWTRHGRLSLGTSVLTEISSNIAAFHMVAQHGYGPSPKPLLRYEHLRECLRELADRALAMQANVQMPRIGAGEAGGSWPVIKEMIEDELCRRGVAVTVCELPGPQPRKAGQLELVEQNS
jgi:hypothetical protein